MKRFCRVLATVAVALLLTVSPLITPSAYAIQDPLPPRKPDRSVTGLVKTPRQPAAVQASAEDVTALAAINILQDPGFEAGTPSSYWTESGTWGSPLCIPADCGSVDGARTGSAWGWFGGWGDGLDESSLSQTVTIPSGTATLEFYLAVFDDEDVPGDANDRFTVMMDGDIIFTANATQEAQYWGYTLVPVDVSAYADDAVHTLVFASTITDQYVAFYLDDVALLSQSAGPEYAISGNAAVAGTVLTYTGGSTTAGPGGAYSFTVPEGWTGTVTPSKAGYVFTPADRTYTPVTADQTAQDYTAVASGNLVEDPSFELDSPNPFWSETYNNYTPFCTPDCGFAGARTGSVWLWFGGLEVPSDTSSVSQAVTIPSGTATLEFYLFLFTDPETPGSDVNDRFTVTLDGATVFSANATQEDQYLDYTSVSVGVSAWADGAEHTLEFSSVTTDQSVSFFVDDVSLVAITGPQYTISGNAAVAGTILTYPGGSTTAGPGGVYSFTVPEGWTGTVTPAKAGYTFTPDSITYTNVTADQTGQDYTVTAPSGNLIEDPSFEVYVPNPYWTETYSNFPILCTEADCGGPGARTGLAWVWFGGLEVPSDTSSVSQEVTIPNGVTTLEFHLLLYTDPVTPGSDANDKLVVKIDDTTVFSVNATQEASYSDYTLASVDVSAHADGAVHTLEFSSITTDQAVSFWLDDVSLEAPLTISGNAGVGGATLTYTGGEPVTAGPTGAYSLPVPEGWTGTVTPSKTGYTFEPPDRTYSTPLTEHQTGQDYTATALLGSVIRVEIVGAASPGCGTDWDTPCDLQYALANAPSGSELWVASGTYVPDGGSGDRTATFQLRSGVAIYGGFAGSESARSERAPLTNVTTLSGDLNGDDGPDFANDIENSYHVITAGGADNTAILDGFTIRGGNADGTNPHFSGGGMYNPGGRPALTDVVFTANRATSRGGAIYNTGSPALTNVGFDGNSASYGGAIYSTGNLSLTDVTFNNNLAFDGGGLHNYGGSPVLTNVVFNSNHAGTSGYGGGMYTDGGSPVLSDVIFSANSGSAGGGLFVQGGSPTLTDIDFFDNDALDGAGMHNSGLSTIMNVTFRSNTATRNGGGLFNNTYSTFTNVTFFDNEATEYAGGGMSSSGNPILTNVTFSGNRSDYGGGLLNSGNTVLRNVILWGNTATTAGPQIHQDTGTPSISNSIVQTGCPAGGACTNIITADPLLGALGNYGGDTQTIPLLPGSSAIAASNSHCPAADQRSAARGTTCDAGAFESQGFSLTLTGGDNQSTPTGAAFPQPLALSVVPNDVGEPVDGGRVTFSGPASGASTSPVTSAVTISGDAASQTVTANSIPGLYIVTASAAGAPGSLAFHLTNIGTDTTAPLVTIDSLSPDPTHAGATLSWHANENGPYSVRVGGTDCATGSVVDSGTYYTAPATVDFTLTAGNLTEGPNAIRVCVTDASSNTGAEHDSVTQDVTAPQTSLDGHPANPSSSSSASFIFSGTDNLTPSLSLAFECRLDGGSFSACTSPREYTGLADGSHTFEVIASDLADNDDLSPASYIWTIDAVPVVLSITRDSANPTAAGSVDFLVTFSETVTGVNIPDFTLTTAGVMGAQVTGLTGSGAIYTVTVNTGTVGSVNGSVQLNLYDNDSIRDVTSHRLGGMGTGNGSFNTGQSYIIAGHMPAPRLVSLSKNQITNDSTPAFTWSAVTDAEYYEIAFAANSTFSQNDHSYFPEEASFTSGFLPDGKYYWRVRAYNAVGEPGTWSASRYFTVDTTLPAVPSSTAPANGTSLKGVPNFRWAAVSGAVLYQFQIDDDPNFLSPLYTIDQRLTSRRLPGGIRGTYYWKVRARDAAGNWSAWSPATSITILPPR